MYYLSRSGYDHPLEVTRDLSGGLEYSIRAEVSPDGSVRMLWGDGGVNPKNVRLKILIAAYDEKSAIQSWEKTVLEARRASQLKIIEAAGEQTLELWGLKSARCELRPDARSFYGVLELIPKTPVWNFNTSDEYVGEI